ncbi:hypothetical protein [Solitalea lacus]|uniref:exodeoxyribonuclease X C-terminal domain-containing protein n=1 Tax=Solitalea lacus TaxID=2911172 RepID=UPI001EDAAF05|nr:hypothetical protein [Solitalea lacus]UKJ08091.1 hypothetical protein L2B55_02735 [Solitalea lacus]
MKFYDLESELKFGKYEGKTLQDIVKLDPDYLNTCAIQEKDFFIAGPVINDLKGLNPQFRLTDVALATLAQKHKHWKIDADIEDDDDEDTYAYFDEQAWKNEFGLPDDDDEASEILSLEAASLEAEVKGHLPGMTDKKDPETIQHAKDVEDSDDALEEFPFEKFDEDIDDWEGNYDEEDEWN